MFHIFKNLFNLQTNFNINITNQRLHNKDKINLSCYIHNMEILAYEDFVFLNTATILQKSFVDFLKTFNCTKSTKDKIYYTEIEIRNTSKCSIKMDDFYSNDPLAIKCANLFAVIINKKKTKQYINASIDNVNETDKKIVFDTIEAGDSIYLRLFHQNDFLHLENAFDILGKTKYFDKPTIVYCSGIDFIKINK